MALGRKQQTTHEDFVAAYRSATAYPKRKLDNLIDRTVEEIKRSCNGLHAGFGWSGGKDSIPLAMVCELAGVTDCVHAMTKGLEYPAFLAWVTANMPPGLRVIANDWDLAWLANHQSWMYPQDSATAAKWYAGIQWKGQARFIKEERIDVLIVGRRYADGNFIPKGGFSRKKNGEVRYAPMRDWSHEEIFALIHHYALPLPPIYDWPRGFRVGTGAWPARRYCAGVEGGWKENWTIEPDIVREAALVIPSAADFMQKHGLT